ncbi:PREDICTED: universal stress protein A-like protein isoform X2 [Nelumbo nucifera]|uniref:Universal stress protein A-like protein isoform X2 n=1 Tax=Nelumbo nucifera TaxID=4432 RepID=A0A1U8ALC0_NELNU|nr:PREDICTED: universal stress protein A-like protein isoform X2 [Nelumbo nucifera]
METTSETRIGGEEAAREEQQQQQHERQTMKVIVAIDESEGSFYALRWAIDNIFTYAVAAPDQSLELSKIYLLHVQQPFQHYIFPSGPAVYATSAVLDSVKKAQEQNSATLLARALQICKERMIKAETIILDGDPKDVICQAAEQIHADYVIVGSRGLGKIKRAFLGSVSDYCAHHVKCPVLIVKPTK